MPIYISTMKSLLPFLWRVYPPVSSCRHCNTGMQTETPPWYLSRRQSQYPWQDIHSWWRGSQGGEKPEEELELNGLIFWFTFETRRQNIHIEAKLIMSLFYLSTCQACFPLQPPVSNWRRSVTLTSSSLQTPVTASHKFSFVKNILSFPKKATVV